MYQKLLTAEIRSKLPKLGTYDGKDPKDIPIAVKFFSPYSGWTWYATEGEEVEGNWIFYGYVRGAEDEFGEFSLSELAEATGMGGKLPLVERDMHFGKHMLAEAIEKRI